MKGMFSAMIKNTTYKDQQTITIDSGKASFTFLPSHGASMVSAKLGDREFMIQRPEPTYRTVPFDGDYVEAECSGMDDMFPTIDVCHYESFPWQGVKLADHGEAWNLPCKAEIDGETVRFTSHGVRLPYIFHKDISMKDDHTLRIDYRAENPTDFPMDFLWACHTMLKAEPGLKLIVPDNCTKAQAVFEENGSIGDYADEFDYPVHVDKNGVSHDFSVMGEPRNCNEKYYFKYPVSKGFCAIEHADGAKFEMRFPEEKVPYLGILQNYGCFRGMYNIFLEPCTASFDRPDIAKAMKKASVIPAQSEYTWHIEIELS